MGDQHPCDHDELLVTLISAADRPVLLTTCKTKHHSRGCCCCPDFDDEIIPSSQFAGLVAGLFASSAVDVSCSCFLLVVLAS